MYKINLTWNKYAIDSYIYDENFMTIIIYTSSTVVVFAIEIDYIGDFEVDESISAGGSDVELICCYLQLYFFPLSFIQNISKIFYQLFSHFLLFNNLFLVSFLSLFFVIQNKALHLTTE
jgi:hypothetical protein